MMAEQIDPEPTVMVFGGSRRRGRPRVSEPRSTLSTWVWAKHHDKLIEIAAKKEVSVSALVRGLIEKALPESSKTGHK